MSYYVIIRGPAGVGKTTVARKIAERLRAKYISFDEVIDKYKLKAQDKEGRIAKDSFVKANEIVAEDTKKEINGGKVVIFDGCFYHKEQLENLEKLLPYKHYVFDLKATVEECIERDVRRKSIGVDAIRAVHNMVSAFDYGERIETGGKQSDEVINELLTIINEK